MKPTHYIDPDVPSALGLVCVCGSALPKIADREEALRWHLAELRAQAAAR